MRAAAPLAACRVGRSLTPPLPLQYAFNLFSHTTAIGPNGYNEEEMKLAKETRKIWGVRRPRQAAALTHPAARARVCSHAFLSVLSCPSRSLFSGLRLNPSFLRMMIETHHYRPEPKPQGYWRQTYAPL